MGTASSIQVQVGARIGRYTVIRQLPTINGQRQWLCQCDCGTERTVQGRNLSTCHSKSCGCVKPFNPRTHGDSRSAEYMAWRGIINRCCNPKKSGYKDYGGRGITVSTEWRTDYIAFLSHVGRRPSPAHSIDRKDNERGYVPGNVRWATHGEQSRNRQDTRFIEYDGQRLVAADWSAKVGISGLTIWKRVFKLGWSVERALTQPSERSSL